MSSSDEEVTVRYTCPVCGCVDHADARDAMVTCSNGHDLTLIGEPDSRGRIEAEVLDDPDA